MTHKILVVDDEENMQVLLKRVLGKAGYDVECAGSGAAALRLAADRPFDLAVVDVCMPEMDGIEVLEKLKGINRQIPVIMISAYPAWGKKQIIFYHKKTEQSDSTNRQSTINNQQS